MHHQSVVHFRYTTGMWIWFLYASALWGGVMITGILFYLFSPAGKCVRSMGISKPALSAASQEFLISAAATSGGELTHFDDTRCEILSDNRTWFLTLTEDVEKAKSSICISTYIWEADEVSGQFFAALGRAVKRGVTVRLLLDSFGSSLNESTIERLRANGIKVKRFRPFKLGKISFYFSRNHRRSYIFDETVAYMGGASVSKKWFVGHNKHSYTYEDVMYRFEGAAVLPALVAFGELWTAACGEVLQVDTPALAAPVQRPNAVFLNHAPRVDIHPYTYLIWYSCVVAKYSIVLCSPYMLPGEALLDILIRKARQGVRVTLITQGTSEIPIVAEASRSHYEQLLAAGVTIYEHKGPAHLHSKLSIIDTEWTIIGSANLDIRSQRINHESVVGVQSKAFANRNQTIIQSYIDNAAHITTESWSKRPFYKKVVGDVLNFFSEQM